MMAVVVVVVVQCRTSYLALCTKLVTFSSQSTMSWTHNAASPLSLGIKILRQVIKENPSPNGWTKAELLKLAHKVPPPPDFKPFSISPNIPALVHPPPFPEHPIRSLG